MPDIDQGAGYGPAGVDVDVLHFQECVDAVGVKVLLHILAHHLTPDIVWSIGDGWREDTAGVG